MSNHFTETLSEDGSRTIVSDSGAVTFITHEGVSDCSGTRLLIEMAMLYVALLRDSQDIADGTTLSAGLERLSPSGILEYKFRTPKVLNEEDRATIAHEVWLVADSLHRAIGQGVDLIETNTARAKRGQ